MSKYEYDIVKVLYRSASAVSGQKLAEQLNISRTAVWKAIDALKEKGYHITSVSNKGYTLIQFPKRWDAHLINLILEDSQLFHKGFIYESLTSTQDEAEKLALNESDPFIVLSEVQTDGRGRFRRNWSSLPDTGLWMSVVLKPDIALHKLTTFNLFIALALAETMHHYYEDVNIKWPNDIFINDKKLSGFLTEIKGNQDQINQIICGIGINLNTEVKQFPEALQQTATSLSVETGLYIDRYQFFKLLICNLEKYYNKFLHSEFKDVKSDYERYALMFDRTLKYTEGNNVVYGKATSMNEDGTLNVMGEDGKTYRFISADIEL